jgi:hypothetical protein
VAVAPHPREPWVGILKSAGAGDEPFAIPPRQPSPRVAFLRFQSVG